MSGNLYPIKKEETGLTIRDYTEILWRRKWWFIIPVFIGVSLSAVYSYSLPPAYRSSTLILVEPQKIPESYVNPTVKSSVEERLNTISQQILSRTNLEKIIKEFSLYKASEALPALPYNAVERLVMKARTFLGDAQSDTLTVSSAWNPAEHVDRMRQAIEISVLGGRKQKNAFTISYSGKEPHTIMSVTNALASLFIEENLKVRERQAEGTSDFLTNELMTVESELREVEKSLKNFKEIHNGSLPDQLDANLKTLDRFHLDQQNVGEEIRRLEERKIIYEQQISETENFNYIKENKVNDNKSNILENQLKELQLKLSKLRSEFTESYPDISILREQINEIEKKISEDISHNSPKDVKVEKENNNDVMKKRANDIKGQVQLVKGEIENLKNKKTNIENTIKEYERRVENTYNNEMELFSLTRDYNISKKNYETILEKKLNAKMSENLEKRQQGEQFKVLDPANLPTKPYMPNRMKITLIGSLGSGVIGTGIILLLEFLYPYFRRPEDFQNLFDLPLLTTISRCRNAARGKHYGLISIDDPNSMITEQYRVLYTKLNDLHERSKGKVFAITSSIKGEGKTLTALNLSVVMARDFGKRTLLLEGDFKTPSLIKFIKQELQSDLVDILLSSTNIQSTSVPFSDTLIPFANDKLSILPAAKSVSNSSGLVSSQSMKNLLSSLKEQYDLVLVDAPSILPLSDMNVFEEVVDGIIVVVRAEKTPKGALTKALQALETEKIVGFVLNDLRQPLPKYYQYPYKKVASENNVKVSW